MAFDWLGGRLEFFGGFLVIFKGFLVIVYGFLGIFNNSRLSNLDFLEPRSVFVRPSMKNHQKRRTRQAHVAQKARESDTLWPQEIE